MAKELRRRLPLDGDDDFLDVRLFIERGSVVGFVLNYTAMIAGQERVVARYDTCHGHLHLHRYWIRDGSPKDLEDPRKGKLTYADQVAAAEKDLQENWREYRAKMELRA